MYSAEATIAIIKSLASGSSGGVSLDKAVVLVANFLDSSTLVITEGAYYGTKQAIASI